MKWLIIIACTMAGAALIWRASRRDDFEPGSDAPAQPDLFGWSLPSVDPWVQPYGAEDTAPDQLPTVYQSFMATASNASTSIAQSVGLIATASPQTAADNQRAFLDMIAFAEGTSGPNGYRTLFGGGLFDSFADHPRQRFPFTNKRGEKLYTTAAGRYQFLSRTWDALVRKLYLPDFGPESQDIAAWELIRERGATKDVEAGRIATAIAKVAPVWASLPGAGYAQPEQKLSKLVASYTAAGGNLEA